MSIFGLGHQGALQRRVSPIGNGDTWDETLDIELPSDAYGSHRRNKTERRAEVVQDM
jgi:hypothetical protein